MRSDRSSLSEKNSFVTVGDVNGIWISFCLKTTLTKQERHIFLTKKEADQFKGRDQKKYL